MDGRDARAETVEAGLEPSPLMKWTSDGSMMEELLKSLTPGAQQPANHNETALVKDASISSTLLALIAQQDDENVAAEGQASGELHTAEHEALPFRSNTADIPTSIKSEDSGWLIDRGAPLLDRELAHSGGGSLYPNADRTSKGLPIALLSRPAVASTGHESGWQCAIGSATVIDAQDGPVQRICSTGVQLQANISIPILPSKLIGGQISQRDHESAPFLGPAHGTPNYIIRQAGPQTQVNLVNASSTGPWFPRPKGSIADLSSHYPALGGYSLSLDGEQQTELGTGLLRDFTQGALPQNSNCVTQSTLALRPLHLDGGLELQQSMCSPSSLPPHPYAGSGQELSQGYESASLPSSASFQRPSSFQNVYQQTPSLPMDTSRDQLANANQQIHALLGHAGRAASAPRERPRPDSSGLPLRPGTPTEQGSDLRTYYAQAGELGSQLAAEYMREAAQKSGRAYAAPSTLNAAPAIYKPTAGLDRSELPRTSHQSGMDSRSRPVVVPDQLVEPPAILTADISRIGEGAHRSEASRSQRDITQGTVQTATLPGSVAAVERGVPRAKRDRSARLAKPPAGPKRSAVGLPPARAVSTDVDEDCEDHSGEAETGSWGDIHMEDRDAKKQLRKEKNRASAAASRARREAYTASLEEEVAKLKEEKSWLEGQVNSPDHAMPMSLPARAPIRHLSI